VIALASANNLETWAKPSYSLVKNSLGRTYLSNTSDVFIAVCLAEAQVFVKTKPDIISIQAICKTLEMKEMLL